MSDTVGAVRRGASGIRVWAEMIKLSHSVFALPFAVVAACLAGRHRQPVGPTLLEWLLIVGCMVAARSFAMTFNRLTDQEIDARNPRTAGRPLPAGRLTRAQAVGFSLICAAAFAAFCAGFWSTTRNPWPLVLAPVVLAYLAGYSFAKRFTSLSHFWLGLAIATAPAAAWIAIHPAGVGWSAALLVLAAGTWIAGFDIIYACQDVEVDRREGLHSLPARLGVAPALWISRACHAVTITALALLPAVHPLGTWYWAGVGVVAVLLAVEQAAVRSDDLSRVNLAFFTINGMVGLVFGATTLADVLRGGRFP